MTTDPQRRRDRARSAPAAALVRAATIALMIGVAGGTSAQVDEATFALGPPEVYKLDWNTRGLTAHDLDGDGRTDLAVVNNDRGRIDLLYQKKPGKAERDARRKRGVRSWEPELEDARFRKESVVTGIRIFALAAGDLNGDGTSDLVYTGNPDGLTFLYQHPRGMWIDKQVFASEEPAQWASAVAVDDVDGDGLDDAVVLGQEELLVFRQREGELDGPQRYPLADPGCYGLVVRDANGDARPDLTYVAPKSRYAWRVRFQRDGGDFGPERAFRLSTPRRYLTPIELPDEDGTAFVSVQPTTGLIDIARLAPATEEKVRVSPRVYSTPSKENTKGGFCLDDFDGDSLLDLAVSDGRGAQVWIYTQLGDGSFSLPTAFPSLSGARSLTSGDTDGDGRAELFVVSPGEGALGVSTLSPEGRLSYPRIVWSEGKPVAAAATDLDGDSALEVACVVTEERTRSVVILGREGDAWAALQKIELEGLRTDPEAIEVLDANQDGRADLAVYIVQSPMRLLLQNEDGAFRDISTADGYRHGLLDGLEAGAVTLGDITGDGKPEMLVAGEGFARAMNVNGDGALTVLDQFNARNREDPIAVALAVELEDNGEPEMLLVQHGGETLQVLARDRKGVYRHSSSVTVGRIEVVGAMTVDLAADGRADVVVLGEDRFWTIPMVGADLEARSVDTHEAELEEMGYVDVVPGDLDGDGVAELVAVDSRESRMLEILTRDGESGWRGVYSFTIFEVDPSYQGRQGSSTEPRQVVLSDLTSDGKLDVALLIHDRVLIYPGLSKPSSDPGSAPAADASPSTDPTPES
jgi:hypothetical protein